MVSTDIQKHNSSLKKFSAFLIICDREVISIGLRKQND